MYSEFSHFSNRTLSIGADFPALGVGEGSYSPWIDISIMKSALIGKKKNRTELFRSTASSSPIQSLSH